jgi:hypothetical protein
MEVRRRSSKRWVLLVLLLFAVGGLIRVGLWFHERSASVGEFRRLLEGDTSVSISKVELRRPGYTSIIDDFESTSYLTAAFRKASTSGVKVGATYECRITMSSGQAIGCCLYFPSEPGLLTVGFPTDSLGEGCTERYSIDLGEPPPKQLSAAFAGLR